MQMTLEERLRASACGRLAPRVGVNSRSELTTMRIAATPGWHLDRLPQGWIILRRPFDIPEGAEPLALHADWVGPIKLVARPGGIEQRIELFLSQALASETDPLLDEEAALALERHTSEVLERMTCLAGQERVEAWEPPAADRCAEWLQQAGCETAIDKDQHLRFTLKRRGCDGQVRVERAEGRLRFVLALGRWKDLSEVSTRAMLRLAGLFNARSRLVRIAWIPQDDTCRCEAQVDLSGLPVPADSDPLAETLWREMMRLAVGGLELALRQLGLELPLLAHPDHADLAEAVAEK